jgi:hypothetical protein
MMQPDEGSYLAQAAAVAGFPNDMESEFRAGYSLIIAPAFWLADTPQGAWLGVKIINSVLFALTLAGLWLSARRLSPATDSRNLVLAVGLTSLYPMWLTMVGYSFAQIAFVPVFLFMFLAYLQAFSGGMRAWLGLGLLAGFLYWIHPMAVAPLIAVLAGGAWIALKRSSPGLFGVLFSSLAAMVLLYQFAIVPWLHAQMNISGLPALLDQPGWSEIALAVASFEGMESVLTHLAGEIFTLTVGTAGLIWLWLISFKTWTGTPEKENGASALPREAMLIFIAFTLLGSLGVSALMQAFASVSGQRLDHWIYASQVEVVLAPVLLLGVLTVSFRKLLWAIPLLVLCTIVLWLDVAGTSQLAPFEASSFWPSIWLPESGVWAWLAAGSGLIALVALAPRKVGMSALAVIFAWSAYVQIAWHENRSDDAMQRWNAALTIREQFPAGSCVAFEEPGIDNRLKTIFWVDFGFVLFDYPMKRMALEQWNSDCDGPLVSFNEEFGLPGTEVYTLALSQWGGPTAWARGLPPAGLAPISWNGETPIQSEVGTQKGSGIQSDGRAGFLVYGPYEPIMAGTYDFQVTGLVESNGHNIEVDVVDHSAGKTFARFKGLGNLRGSSDARLLKSRIVLKEDVERLEIRVHVEEDVDVYIDGYSLEFVPPETIDP